jgi:hypothetical protein
MLRFGSPRVVPGGLPERQSPDRRSLFHRGCRRFSELPNTAEGRGLALLLSDRIEPTFKKNWAGG